MAARAGSTEQETKLFLDALNAQIREGLKQDKQVKVNGIGTFRLQNMAPRESMNINTGERITIKGYEKIVFAPEAGVKELIEHNTPMKKKNAKQVTDEINPLEKLGEQADEIVGILADLGQSPAEEEKPKKTKGRKAAAAKAVEPKAETVELKAEKPKARKQPAAKQAKPAEQAEPTTPAGQTEPVIPAEPQPAAPVELPEAPKAQEAPKSEEKKEKNHFLRDTLICVIILLLLLLVGYFFLRSQISNWLDSLNNPQPAQTEVVVEAEEPATAVETAAPAVPEEIVYDKLITTERMHRHSRLAWMAFRYYGDKQFWVYLYDANKDHIVNPDKIVVGTPIRVPQLTKEQMDTTLPATRATLQRLLEQGEEAKKK